MASRKMNFFEKQANLWGVLYRHQAKQFPRRWELLKEVAKKELAPPRSADIPAIKADWAKVVKAISNQEYKNYTVRELLLYTAVGLEIAFFFFIGEMIGRRNAVGYLVPGSYISGKTRCEASHQKPQDPHAL
ncbi:unnamed protein product, partial [Mesorhabditis belari]|uniref:ATP synthase subunit g, mitochondrial n=1 Tax=Mesorhabditis belari TaxID=2138241 RepID=A0AAF3EHB4_9BILA